MIQCPECRSMIPDDSAFCDQCGKELKWCPECKRPKRGSECPVCGSDLVPGRKYLAGPAPKPDTAPKSPDAAPKNPDAAPKSPDSAPKGPDAAPVSSKPASQPTAAAFSGPSALVGNGWRLTLREGSFGRSGGIWPELSTCPYVSGSHGRIEKSGGSWLIADNGSTNGTFVNDNRIRKEFLKNGDRVRIATLNFIVE